MPYGKTKKPTCFDCVHALISPGTVGDYYNPPEPPMAECQNEEVDEKLLEENEWDEKVMPSLCGHFKPRLIDKCHNCKKEINAPEWSWKLWANTIWDYMPVCSEECKKIVEDATEKEIEEMTKFKSLE
jgi:hypothetical protein